MSLSKSFSNRRQVPGSESHSLRLSATVVRAYSRLQSYCSRVFRNNILGTVYATVFPHRQISMLCLFKSESPYPLSVYP